MQQNGPAPKQVTQIRGYADTRLRKPDAPEDPANRRISVIVHYMAAPNMDEDDKAPAKAEPKSAAVADGKHK